jgi:23S rRNA pseudouridine2605 synthase
LSAERLQKVLAAAGVASRRDCEEMIRQGRISVNGRVMRELGARVDPAVDSIAVDGVPVLQHGARTYILLHKPVGVVSTADDPQGRPTVIDLVDSQARLFPVGRLDMDSEGLLLLTDDGDLAYRLTHPSFAVEKEYRVLLDRVPSPEALRGWREGLDLDGQPTAPAWVEVLDRTDDGVWVRVVLREGRKRQVREVAGLLGYEVLRLVRVREGSLVLGDLPAGRSRALTDQEVEALRRHTAESRAPEPGRAREREAGVAKQPTGEGRRSPGRERPRPPTSGLPAQDVRRPQGERSNSRGGRPEDRDSRPSNRGERGDRFGAREERPQGRAPNNSRYAPRSQYEDRGRPDSRPARGQPDRRVGGGSRYDPRGGTQRGSSRYDPRGGTQRGNSRYDPRGGVQRGGSRYDPRGDSRPSNEQPNEREEYQGRDQGRQGNERFSERPPQRPSRPDQRGPARPQSRPASGPRTGTPRPNPPRTGTPRPDSRGPAAPRPDRQRGAPRRNDAPPPQRDDEE